MSRPHHPLKAQEYITAFNKKFIQPTKAALNSDIVKKNITEPTKKFLDQQLVKEYVTDPLIDASSGDTACLIKSWIKEDISWIKNDIQQYVEPLLPPGLTEADVRDSGTSNDGYVLVYGPEKTELVETDRQRKLVEPWEDDTWENDEESIFKPCSSLPSRSDEVFQFQDRNGQEHTAPMVDITDDLRSPQQLREDVKFRDNDLVALTTEEKGFISSKEKDKDHFFREQDFEDTDREMQYDIDNFEAAGHQSSPGLLKEMVRVFEAAGYQTSRGLLKEIEKMLAYTSEYLKDRKRRRQTSRERSESRNRQLVASMMARSIPRRRSREAQRRPNFEQRQSDAVETSDADETSDAEIDAEDDDIHGVWSPQQMKRFSVLARCLVGESVAEYREPEFSAGDLADIEEDPEDPEDYEGSEREEGQIYGVSQLRRNLVPSKQEVKRKNVEEKEKHSTKRESKIGQSSNMFASAQEFLAPSQHTPIRPDTVNASKTSVPKNYSDQRRDSGYQRDTEGSPRRGRTSTRLGSYRSYRRNGEPILTPLH